ncbi:MAG: FmdB family zinc ribbon protein [Gemmatimonadota bacterium]
MPTYEYRCQKGHEFEVFQRMSEPPLEHCIHCGAHAERLLSAGAGLIFKGSGFYITDYARSDSYKKAAETDKGGSTPPAKPADSGGTGTSGDTSGKGGTSTATGASGTA